MTKPISTACPCGSQLLFSQCCEPYIQKKKTPKTAEQLLRSRYTAFTLENVDYIAGTHHSKTASEVDRKEIEDWSRNSEWLGLFIERKEKGEENDQQGLVTFCAKFKAKNESKIQEHWEHALFEKENGEWKFLDARGVKQEPLRRTEPKVGRNDPCPCGSGKKFKKCCAQGE